MTDDELPTKNKYRARRRQLMHKTKDKARRIIDFLGWPSASVKLAEHLQWCNCISCRNKRELEGDTLQERKAKLKEHDDG
jgi:hypothetical protein